MNRYSNNLIHWKTRKNIGSSNCYSGDQYCEEIYQKLRVITELEIKIKKLKKEGNKEDLINNKEEVLVLRKQYEIEKNYKIKKSSYEMFPDNTLIHCQLISNDGDKIKEDGSKGNELVWCRVLDQRCFYSNILYAVIPLGKTEVYSTRASLTNWPRPNPAPQSFLCNCKVDDSITGPPIVEGIKLSNNNLKNKLQQRLQADGLTKETSMFITQGVSHMDDNNREIAKVMADKGMDEAVKSMFKHPTEKDSTGNPRQLSYAEMRGFYG